MPFQKPYLKESPRGDNELSNVPKLVKSLIAEMLGVMFLVLIGCGSCGHAAHDDFVRIALAFGVTVATLAQSIGHVSGCHINPAITAGLITGAKIGVIKGLLYIVFQCIGGLIGGALLMSFTPAGKPVPGATLINEKAGITVGQGFGIEMLITFVLVLVVFAAAADENNAINVKGSAPLAIGLSITTCHLFAIPYTGSSMNPARSFGIAPFANNAWENHWVYWIGPILGGVLAALVYLLLFKADQTYKVVSSTDKNELKELKTSS